MRPRLYPGFLLLAFDFPPLDGGIPRLCAMLAQTLFERGLDVRVLSTEQRSAGMALPRLPVSRVACTRGRRELETLLKLGRTFAGAVLLCANWYPEGLIATLRGRRPRVILVHGGELLPPRSAWRRRLWPALLRQVLTSADLVVANSRYTASLVQRFAPGARLETIPLAVDSAQFQPGDRSVSRQQLAIPEAARVILTVSRLQAYKGHDLVLNAIAALPARLRANLLWLVAGRGEEAPRLREMARRLGVASNVRWLGFVPDSELVRVYQCADAFVLCTREAPLERVVEGFGMVLLEAQACGVSVIGTRTGGIPEALEQGRGGFLIDQDDREALTRLLERVVSEPEFFHRAGAEARQRVAAECTWPHYLDHLLRAFSRIGLEVAETRARSG